MFEEIIKPLINKKCFKIKRSYGSMLVLEFGSKVPYFSPKTGKNYRGEWTLIVNTSNWKMYQKNIEILNGDSKKPDIDTHVDKISDLKIINIIDSENSTAFIFENDFKIEVYLDTELEEFDLYTPNDMVLTMGPNHKYTYQKSQ